MFYFLIDFIEHCCKSFTWICLKDHTLLLQNIYITHISNDLFAGAGLFQ
jgi:hypothetical protein